MQEVDRAKDFKQMALKFFAQVREIILSPFRLFRLICIVVGFTVILATAGVGFTVFSFFKGLPDIHSKSFKQFKLDGTLKVHSKFKKKKQRQKYFWTPIDKINRELLYAVVMSEDSTYLNIMELTSMP